MCGGALEDGRVWRLASNAMTRLERRVNITAVLLPFLVVAVAVPLLWGRLIGASDVIVFAVMYVAVRPRRHRRLPPDADPPRVPDASRRRGTCSPILGSMAVQGPVIEWVADHRKHHAHTDEEGDPHSPHVGHGAGVRGALRGLWHAHVGWLWRTNGQARAYKYARELVEDRGMKRINRAFPQLVLASLALPALLGFALTGTLRGALTGPAVGRLRADLRPAPRHVVGQLDLPLLRDAAASPSRTTRPTSSGSRCRPSASPGTTTTMRSRARPRTACAGGSSIPSEMVIRAHAPPRTRVGRRPDPPGAPAAEADDLTLTPSGGCAPPPPLVGWRPCTTLPRSTSSGRRRALVYLVYFFVTVALIVLTFGFFLLLLRREPGRRVRGAGLPLARPRHGTVSAGCSSRSSSMASRCSTSRCCSR